MLRSTVKRNLIRIKDFILGYRYEIISGASGLMLLTVLLLQNEGSKNYYSQLSKSIDYLVDITSILSGIIIAFLAAKVIQIRQEKLSLLPNLLETTKKLHYFRRVVQILHRQWDFWPDGLRNHIDRGYAGLTYFDVRDIVFVDREVTTQANAFITDTTFGEIVKQTYLEVKSFLPENHFDRTLYTEFEVNDILYTTDALDKWQEYSCGNMMWYCFINQYSNYRGLFNFESFSRANIDEIKNLSNKIDKERYEYIEFGPELIGKLGNQIEQDLIPKLSNLQHQFDGSLPLVVKFMYRTILFLLIFGAVIPVITTLLDLSTTLKEFSLIVTLSFTLYFLIKLPSIMRTETYS